MFAERSDAKSIEIFVPSALTLLFAAVGAAGADALAGDAFIV
jgi:hypothetical protein